MGRRAEALDRAVAKTVARSFAESGDFNGMPLTALAALHGLSDEDLRLILVRLVHARQLDVVFGRFAANQHIKRLDDAPPETQVGWIEHEPLDDGCAYPSQSLAEDELDPDDYAGRPYSLRLALAQAQLHAVFFEPMVLERYRTDPRYLFQFEDYSGTIAIGDESSRSEEFPERDKVLMQTFGLGWRPDLSPAVVVFLRYLSGLTVEHQAYWQSFELPDGTGCFMDPDYYTNSIIGDWTDHGSLIGALLEEQQVINAMAEAMGRPPLFRLTYRGNRPLELTPFLVPTARNFDSFCLTLDKILSDNLSQDFFLGELAGEEEVPRPDGKVEVRRIGTIRQLESWLRVKYRPADGDDPASTIAMGLQAARKGRQPAAHRVLDDRYDPSLWGAYLKLLEEAYLGVRTLRLALASHSAAAKVEVPDWLYKGNFRSYVPRPKDLSAAASTEG